MIARSVLLLFLFAIMIPSDALEKEGTQPPQQRMRSQGSLFAHYSHSLLLHHYPNSIKTSGKDTRKRPNMRVRGETTMVTGSSETQTEAEEGKEVKEHKIAASKREWSRNRKSLVGGGMVEKHRDVVDLHKHHKAYEEHPSLNADSHGPHPHPGSLSEGKGKGKGKRANPLELPSRESRAQAKWKDNQRSGRMLRRVNKDEEELQDVDVSESSQHKAQDLASMMRMDYRGRGRPKPRKPIHN